MLDATPQGPEFLVNTHTTNNQINAAAAMDATGNFVVVWQSTAQDGHSDGIFAQRFNAIGQPQGEEFQVNQFTTGAQQTPAVAMDADGDFVIAWNSPNQGDGGPTTSAGEIWARRFNIDGTPKDDEFHVNTITTQTQITPHVAIDADGDFIIAWTSRDFAPAPNAGYDIYARRYDPSGNALAIEQLVNTYTTGSQTGPVVAVDDDGDHVIVWQSFGQDGDVQGVYAQRFNASGTPQGVEFRVNEVTPSSQGAPVVDMDAIGNFVVAWESNGQDGDGFTVMARRYSFEGQPQSNEFTVNTFTTEAQRLPAVALDSNGDFVITWASREQDESGYGIYAQAYSAAGAPVGSEFKVSTYTTLAQYNPAIAMDADGDFVIAWHSGDSQDGSGYGVYAQRYGTDVTGPEVLTTTFVWQNAPQRLVYRFSTDVSASLSNADLILHNLTTMQDVPVDNITLLNYDTATNTATFTFPGYLYGALPNGNYRATIPAGSISDPGGMPLAFDHVFQFFFLMGDVDHNRIVNLFDFNILAINFGQSGRDFTQGNFDYDPTGTVNLQDFNQLAINFGRTLPAPLQTTAQSGAPLFGTRSGGGARDQLGEELD
jgi:hypothetical protein